MRNKLIVLGLCFLAGACAHRPDNAVDDDFIPEPAPVGGQMKPLSQFSAEELTRRYGTPNFVRKEPGSEIWRYDAGACRVFFFFYPQNGGLRIRQMESTPPGKPGHVSRNCFNALELRVKQP